MSSNLEQTDQLTRFVGRETELNETRHILNNPDCHLLTLAGVGGIGKTRLAVQLARDQQQAFPHGVWFVNLQPLQSRRQIVFGIADVLGVVLSGHDTPENQLLHYLQDKKLLLLLDNFEHLLDDVRFVTRIIVHAPAVKLLVTSREALSAPEEWLYPIEGLPIPLSHQIDNVESVTAVELFVERAHHSYPNFSLADNRAGVIRICRLVDGHPLALEIAASWTRAMRCSEIAAEIEHNLNFLTSNLRHVPERHRSVQAVFAQTWEHLTESEQTLFKRLAVFKGGFRREAAEHIAEASLPLLSSLVDKCLLRRDGGGHYQIHELLRQYAGGKLDSSETKSLAEAHCLYYCDFLARRKLGLAEQEQVKNSLEIEDELENVRAAWQYAVEHQLLDALRKAAGSYFFFCQIQSRYLEYAEAAGLVAEAFERARDLSGLAQILVYRGWMLIRIGSFEQAYRELQRSRALFEELRLTPEYGMGSHPLAPSIVLHVIRGEYASAVALGEQLKLQMTGGTDRQNLGFAYYGLVGAYLNLGQYQVALEHAEEALKLFNAVGNHWLSAYCHIELGNVHQAMGHYGLAERHYQASLHIKQEYNDPEGIAVSAKHLGEISLLQHDYQAARQQFEQSLSTYQKLNDQGGLAAAHHSLGKVASQTGPLDVAAHHYQKALEIADSINFIPLLLSVLIDIGVLMLNNGRKMRGLELLRLVHSHPAANEQQQKQVASLLDPGPFNPPAPRSEFETAIIALRSELQELAGSPPASRSPLIEPLTDRELEVLNLIALGLSNPAIAGQLIISVGTVKAHTNRIYAKLGVTNRVEAVTRARQLWLLGD